MKQKHRFIFSVSCLVCLLVGFFAVPTLSSERFAEVPPILWDELAVDYRDTAFLFAAVRGIVEARYTLMDIDETMGRMETAWLLEKETGGKFRFVIVVEPGVVHLGHEIVSPPRGDTADDVYGSMLFFFLEIANRERDKILADIREGLTQAEEPEN